jgi:glycolate oxidase
VTGLSAPTGNLRPIVVVERGATVTEVPPWEAACAVFDLALRLGGTLTGEHGVGILKREWLRQELGKDSLALQRASDPLVSGRCDRPRRARHRR